MNWIALNRWQSWLHRSLHLAPAKQCIWLYNLHHLLDDVVQIHLLPDRFAFFHHSPDAANHLAGAASIRADIDKQLAKLPKSDISIVDKTLASGGVAHNPRERLIQFVG